MVFNLSDTNIYIANILSSIIPISKILKVTKSLKSGIILLTTLIKIPVFIYAPVCIVLKLYPVWLSILAKIFILSAKFVEAL